MTTTFRAGSRLVWHASFDVLFADWADEYSLQRTVDYARETNLTSSTVLHSLWPLYTIIASRMSSTKRSYMPYGQSRTSGADFVLLDIALRQRDPGSTEDWAAIPTRIERGGTVTNLGLSSA